MRGLLSSEEVDGCCWLLLPDYGYGCWEWLPMLYVSWMRLVEVVWGGFRTKVPLLSPCFTYDLADYFRLSFPQR